MAFAIPSTLPQDLRLIHDLIGDIASPPKPTTQHEQSSYQSDHDHGTDSDTDSEKEVEADILAGVDDDPSPPSESTSNSDSSSESDSESEEPQARKPTHTRNQADEDDEDAEPTVNTELQRRTKNEILDVDIPIPDILEVGAHEHLERVGEIMNIVDKVVIVRGNPSFIVNRGSEQALDSDTLLVFEDRKVLGYIFETFGPTSEPLYQIRFNQKHPLNSENVQIGRPVFHVPAKSNYVFVRQLRHLKGSDASNVYDEEPGEDELEYSDDEQEAAHRRAQAGRREQARARSVASSRHSTLLISRTRDQDMVDDPYGGPSYDFLPYTDASLDAGPSRPAPIPYDDPYSDSYGSAPLDAKQENSQIPQSPRQSQSQDRGRGRGGHNRSSPQRREDCGRGRGRHRNDRGGGRGRGRASGHRLPNNSADGWSRRSPEEYDPHNPRAMSPASFAIASATGQHADGSPIDGVDVSGGWAYPGTQYPMHHPMSFEFFSYQYPHVQPHINPRFAANFGMAGTGTSYTGTGDSVAYGPDGARHRSDTWNGEWGTAHNAPTSQEGG